MALLGGCQACCVSQWAAKKTPEKLCVLYLLIPLICAMRLTLQANTNVTPDFLSSIAPFYCNAAGKNEAKSL